MCNKKHRFCKFVVAKFRFLKNLCFPKTDSTPKNNANPVEQHEKLSEEAIVIIPPKSIESSTGTLRPMTRPQVPPPPPPPAAALSIISFRPKRPPPPRFLKPQSRKVPPPPPPSSSKPHLKVCAIPMHPTAAAAITKSPKEDPIQLRRNEILWGGYEKRITHKFADFADEH